MRIGHLMIAVVDNITANYEDDDEVIVKAANVVEKDVHDLLRCASYT
jgi:hypothetical protein